MGTYMDMGKLYLGVEIFIREGFKSSIFRGRGSYWSRKKGYGFMGIMRRIKSNRL